MAAQLALVQTTDQDYLRDVKRKFVMSQNLCEPARLESKNDQGYYEGPGQWTSGERETLRRRRQPDEYFNEVKPAVNGLIGIVLRGKTDPQAWGRNPQDENAGDVATDILRYAADKSRFQSKKRDGLKDYFVAGTICAVVEIGPDKEIQVNKGRPERFFYDPRSSEPDFSDARWLGLANWMDEDDALELAGDDEEKRRLIKQGIDASDLVHGATHEDKPSTGWSWADNKQRRVMVVHMWHRRGPVWYSCKFTANCLIESGPSPYKGEDGHPACQLIAQSCYVNEDNERYGVVRDMRGPQNAENKGWSKIIHILNVAKLRVSKRVQDVDSVREQYARPDGIVEAEEGEVEELGTDKQMVPAHLQMLQVAKEMMRRQSPTPSSVGRQGSSQSGRAQLVEQEAGETEHAILFDQIDDWCLRIYRAMWLCAKQFWDEPKWIRVTDDEDAPKYVLLNQQQPVTDQNTGQPVLDPQTGQPQMKMLRPAEMDVDIIIDATRDVATLQHEQWNKMIEMESVRPGTWPTPMLIKASSLPHKKRLLDELKKHQEQQQGQPNPAQIEEQKAQVQLAANDKKNQQNLAANDAKLQRESEEADKQALRDNQLEDKRHANKMAEMDRQRQEDELRRGAEFDHGQRMAQQSFDFEERRGNLKTQQAASKPSAGGQSTEDDDDMRGFNIQLPPEMAEALTQLSASQMQQVTQSKLAAAQAQEQVPQALLEAAAALKQSAEIQAEVAQETLRILKAPKRLNVNKQTGEKTVEVVA